MSSVQRWTKGLFELEGRHIADAGRCKVEEYDTYGKHICVGEGLWKGCEQSGAAAPPPNHF